MFTLYVSLFPDVDECARGLYICPAEAECRDADGDYECICAEGLKLSEDGLRCVGKKKQ